MSPDPKRASRYHHGDLKRALVDAAIELLATEGLGFTLRQAATRVGVTHAAAYRHFADRAALTAEVARRGFEDLTAAVRRAMRRAGDDPRGRLEALLVAYLRFAWKRPAQYDLMFGPRLNESGRFDDLEAAVVGAVRALSDAVADYLGDPDPIRARDVGIAIWSFAHGFASNVLRKRIHVRSLRAAEGYLKHVVAPLLDGAVG